MFNVQQIANNLAVSPEGIWVTSPGSMAFEFLPYDQTDWPQVQKHSFWYKHRNNCFRELFRNFPLNSTLLEVGGG